VETGNCVPKGGGDGGQEEEVIQAEERRGSIILTWSVAIGAGATAKKGPRSG